MGLQISLKKTKFFVINSDASVEVLIEDNVEITQVEKLKYLGACIGKNGLGENEIRHP